MAEYQGLLIVLANILAFAIIVGVIVHDIKSGRVGKRSKTGKNASSHAAAQRRKPSPSGRGRSTRSPARATFEMPHDTGSGPKEVRLPTHLEQMSDKRVAKRKKETPEGLSTTQLAVIVAGATDPD